MFKHTSAPKIFMILAVALMLVLPATHVQPVQAAGTITSCSQSAFVSALSGGGTVIFDVDCSAVPIVLTTPVTISSNTVIKANDHRVTISGGSATRIFIVNSGITLELDGLNITNGSAGALSGGAVQVLSTGVLIANNTTFTNNTSLSGNGGAIFINGGSATIINSTFSGNITYGTGNEGKGGAIFADNGAVTVKNVTFSGNGARDGGGGGLYVQAQTSITTSIYNSIFTANQGGNCLKGGNAVITDNLGNISFGDVTCLPSANHQDPLLSSIGEYGSKMPLFALQTGSPAINLATANCPEKDQRGVSRSTPSCDSGSYEYRLPTTMAVTSETTSPSIYGQNVVFQAAVTPSAATGLVEFYANGVMIGSANLNFGTATMATGVLRAGTYAITARYFGDSQYEVVDGSLAASHVVNKKLLTITADNKSRKYGNVNPSFTWQAAGFVNNENSTVFTNQPTCGTTAVIDSPVSGNPYPITCSGATAANYTFDYAAGELTILPDVLTVTAQNSTRPYGDPNPTFDFAITGFRVGDDISKVNPLPSCGTTATATSAVTSTYPITCSGGTAANYSFAFVDGQLTITPVQLTVIPDPKSRPYGAENPSFTAQFTGFKNGETSLVLTNQPTCTTTAVSTSPVLGSPYPITCSGATAVNYTFSYPTSGLLTITKAMLTLTAQNKAKFYGSGNPDLTYTISGLVGTDTASATCSTDATTSSPVGPYPINCQGAESANYNFTPVPGLLAVNKAPLTVKADNKTRLYGSPNPDLTASFSGFVLGETDVVVDPKPTCETTAAVTSPASVVPYSITCSGGAAANYELNYQAGGLTVTKVILHVTVANKTRSYGADNPDSTYTITNFVGSDSENDIDQLPICTTPATSGSPAGSSYPITCAGASDINYAFDYQQGTLTIEKAPLTVTAENKSKVYGTTNPPFTYIVAGLRTGETIGVFTTPVTCTSEAGVNSPVAPAYAITCDNGAAANYTFNYVAGQLTVTKAMLTVTANNTTKLYGAAVPPLTHVVHGLVTPDTEADFTAPVICTTGANETNPVGNYPISCSSGEAANYNFTYVPGSLTVSKAPLTVKADDKSRLYGSENPPATFTYSGFVLSNSEADLATKPTCSTTALPASPVIGSPYPITCAGGVDESYEFVYQSGNLTVTKAALSVVVDDKTRGYGQPNPTPTFTISGYLNEEGPSVVTKQPICSTTANASSPVGSSHEITCAGAEAANYTFIYTSGTLTITDAALTVVVNNKTKTYGSENPTLTYTILGLRTGDTEESVFTSPIICNSEAVKTSPVRETAYWIRCLGGQPVNYTVNYLDGELTVTKAELTVAADPITKPFLQPVPALTFTITGYVNGEDSSVISGSPQLTTTATQNSKGGQYPIFTRVGTLAADNYTFKLVDGTFTIVLYQMFLPTVVR